MMLEDDVGFVALCLMGSLIPGTIIVAIITNSMGAWIVPFAFVVSLFLIPLYKAFYDCHVEERV